MFIESLPKSFNNFCSLTYSYRLLSLWELLILVMFLSASEIIAVHFFVVNRLEITCVCSGDHCTRDTHHCGGVR